MPPLIPDWRLPLLCDRLALHIPIPRKSGNPQPEGQPAKKKETLA